MPRIGVQDGLEYALTATRIEILHHRRIQVDVEGHPEHPGISKEPDWKDENNHKEYGQGCPAPAQADTIDQEDSSAQHDPCCRGISEVRRTQKIAAFPGEKVAAVAAAAVGFEEVPEDLSFDTDQTTQPEDAEDKVPEGDGNGVARTSERLSSYRRPAGCLRRSRPPRRGFAAWISV